MVWRVSVAGNLDPSGEWNYALSQGLNAALEFATTYSLLPRGSSIVDLVIIPSGFGVDSAYRVFYARKPRVKFYIPVDASSAESAAEDLMHGLGGVLHEITHVAYIVGGQWVERDLVREIEEETRAGVVELCWKITRSNELKGISGDLTLRRLPDVPPLEELVSDYGAAGAGAVLAAQDILADLKPGEGVSISDGVMLKLRARCGAALASSQL